jgi:sialic acid synthase SpsE
MNSDKIWEKITNGVLIIAEIGKNFIQSEDERSIEEYLHNACALVDEAVASGAGAVKFQTHNYEDEQMSVKIVSPHFKGSDRYNWVKRNSLATSIDGFWRPLKEYCESKGVIFFSTPMSRGAAMILDELGVNLWKVGSGDILDFVMLDYLRRSGKPIIISSGMSTLEETEKALNFLRAKNERVALLHCVSKYPCPPEDLNLSTVEFYRERFNLPIGFSDHSLSTDTSVLAVAMGAKIIEKHFSLSRTLWGSDHKVSLLPEEMKDMVEKINRLQQDQKYRESVLKDESTKKYYGIKGKIILDDEAAFRPIFRKSLVAARDIKKGEEIKPEMLYAMRPQQYVPGLPSERYEDVLGKFAAVDVHKLSPISESALS